MDARRAMRHASWNACFIAPGLALPWPAMSNAVPCAGVVIGDRQAALHRDAAPEAHQLHRDLALVVVHRDHAVVLALLALHLEKDRVGGERPLHRDAARTRRLDRRPMTSISSRPNEPLSPLCGLRPHTAMRGCAMPAPAIALAMSSMPRVTPSAVICVGHVAQRDVRRDARGPQAVEHVELAHRAVESSCSANQCSSSLVRMPGQVQRVLVERRKQHRIGHAALHRMQAERQRVEAVAAALGRADAALERAARVAAKVEQQRRVRRRAR